MIFVFDGKFWRVYPQLSEVDASNKLFLNLLKFIDFYHTHKKIDPIQQIEINSVVLNDCIYILDCLHRHKDGKNLFLHALRKKSWPAPWSTILTYLEQFLSSYHPVFDNLKSDPLQTIGLLCSLQPEDLLSAHSRDVHFLNFEEALSLWPEYNYINLLEKCKLLAANGRQIKIHLPRVEQQPFLETLLDPIYEAIYQITDPNIEIVTSDSIPQTPTEKLASKLLTKTQFKDLNIDEILHIEQADSFHDENRRIIEEIEKIQSNGDFKEIKIICNQPVRRTYLTHLLTQKNIPFQIYLDEHTIHDTPLHPSINAFMALCYFSTNSSENQSLFFLSHFLPVTHSFCEKLKLLHSCLKKDFGWNIEEGIQSKKIPDAFWQSADFHYFSSEEKDFQQQFKLSSDFISSILYVHPLELNSLNWHVNNTKKLLRLLEKNLLSTLNFYNTQTMIQQLEAGRVIINRAIEVLDKLTILLKQNKISLGLSQKEWHTILKSWLTSELFFTDSKKIQGGVHIGSMDALSHIRSAITFFAGFCAKEYQEEVGGIYLLPRNIMQSINQLALKDIFPTYFCLPNTSPFTIIRHIANTAKKVFFFLPKQNLDGTQATHPTIQEHLFEGLTTQPNSLAALHKDHRPKDKLSPSKQALPNPLLTMNNLGIAWGTDKNPISASKLEAFFKSPIEYFLNHFLNLPSKPPQLGYVGKEKIGFLAHQIISLFFNKLFPDGRVTTCSDEKYETIFHSVYHEQETLFVTKEFGVKRPKLKWELNKLKNMLSYWIISEKNRLIPGSLIQHEQPFVLRLSDEKKYYFIAGRMDRTVQDNGHLSITDYKMGGIAFYEHQLKHELFSTCFQLPIYMLAGHKKIGPKTIQARYQSIRQQSFSADLVDILKDSYDSIESIVAATKIHLINKINQARNTPLTTTPPLIDNKRLLFFIRDLGSAIGDENE